MKRGDLLDKQELLDDSNNGIDIFKEEIVLKRKGYNLVGLCPLHGEKTPSFTIFPNGIFKCFGCQEAGDIFSFLMKRYGITYKEALLKVKDNISLNPVEIVKNKPKIAKKKELLIQWEDMLFSDKHREYFDRYELDEKFLNKMDIFGCKKYAINGKVVKIPDNWFQVCYFAADINEVKILTLGEGVPEDMKWRSFNIPNNYLWYYYKFKDVQCEDLFIVKSNKDAAVMTKLSHCCIATQNEDATTLISNRDKIEAICKHPYIVFGSDKQGKQASLDANKVLNWRYFNTRNYLLRENVNDPASLVEFSSSAVLEKEIQKSLKKWKKQ